MLNRLLLNIVIILILPLSVVCQTDPVRPHPEGFLITREFAELTAARFDSLKFYKLQTERLTAAADTCNSLLNYAETVVKAQNDNYNILYSAYSGQAQIIESYKRTEQINADIKRSLKIETRKRKAWKVAAITAAGLFTTSVFYIALR